MRIFLLNGPPRCGKDTLGSGLAEFLDYEVIKFAQPLRDTLKSWGMHGNRDFDEWYETEKETPQLRFGNLTPRQLAIKISEEWMKPTFGPEVFGQIAKNKAMSCVKDGIVVTDCGFLEEAEVFLDIFGAEKITLCHIHRDGCDFTGDSRSFIYLPGVHPYEVINNGSVVSGINQLVRAANADIKRYGED